MAKKKHLIIGSGPAALSALQKIRSITSEDEIKLVTRENCLPYSLAVLPYLISRKIKEDDIWLVDETYLQKMKASFAKGKEVIEVLPERKEIVYKDGDRDKYDTLLIACGAKPVRLPIKGLAETDSLTFHTIADYRKLIQQLETRRDVTIYGGGLVAVELAIALLERGYNVKVVVRSRILRRYWDKEVGDFIADIFRSKGANIYSGSEISEAKRTNNKIEIALASGDSFQTDILISSTGVNPQVSFLKGTGIGINQGILADQWMRTNISDVYVAGDVAEAPSFFNNELGVNAILPSAIHQGKIAGANMAEEETEDKGWISMNVLKFWGNSACSIGLSTGQSGEVLEEKDEKLKRCRKLVFREDKLVGASFLNIDVDPGVFVYLVEKQVNVEPHKAILFQKPREISRWLMLENEKEQTKSLEA